MLDDYKTTTDTVKIEISHFQPSLISNKQNEKDSTIEANNDNNEEISHRNTMKISIESKNAKSSVINVNVNNDGGNSKADEKIQIKIENKRKDIIKPKENKDSNSPNLRKGKLNPPVNDSNNNKSKVDRTDALGNKIRKGSKKHKVTFLDNKKFTGTGTGTGKAEDNFISVVDIESYKQYNLIMCYPEGGENVRKERARCCSKCEIF
jgi:hypothetical protein